MFSEFLILLIGDCFSRHLNRRRNSNLRRSKMSPVWPVGPYPMKILQRIFYVTIIFLAFIALNVPSPSTGAIP